MQPRGVVCVVLVLESQVVSVESFEYQPVICDELYRLVTLLPLLSGQLTIPDVIVLYFKHFVY